ncbi:DUF2189 domain-containing protein [Thiohalophilus sp.]|uniref:DUF2189 domain-containing protein n=1 Tax=Thiohalophilus sp. TaxID=3028392 RepID=UPI003975AE02
MTSTPSPEESEMSPDELPFVAPCRELDTGAPLRWLKLGWRDLRRAPGPSLSYGAALLLISYLISAVAWHYGSIYLLLAMLSGFIFIGPVLAVGLYSISRQLQSGRRPVLGYCLREGHRHLGNLLVFAVILLVVFLVWARAASMVHIFFPVDADPELADFALFLGVGSAVGTIFAAVVFCASAFSLPMLLDRRADTVTAVLTSVNAVLRNKPAMLLWAALIVAILLAGFATGLLGLALGMPVVGHATWHAYQETIDASAWPQNAVTVQAGE